MQAEEGQGEGDGGNGLHPAVAKGAAMGIAAAEPRMGGKETENNWAEGGRQAQPGSAARHVPLQPPQQPWLPRGLALSTAPPRPGVLGTGTLLMPLVAEGGFEAVLKSVAGLSY